MPDTRSCTYEDLYYEMWEMSQRYRQIAQFRIIGKSHDERMIPMIELGKGNSCIFCLSGLTGPDRQTPKFLIRMIQEYTKAWESGWKIEEIYDVREALDKWRLCFIPLLNPDGYEIYERDFQAIRNPIYRQMLRMQEISAKEYTGNGRGIDLRKNFPTQYYQRRQVMQQPASENETKAMIRIFQEYPSSGLLSFNHFRNRILYFKQSRSFAANQKSYRLARHLQKCSSYYMDNLPAGQGDFSVAGRPGSGSPEQFYAEICHKPSFRIETLREESEDKEEQRQNEYRKIHTLPLEYLFSL